jgi:hypothetical protein
MQALENQVAEVVGALRRDLKDLTTTFAGRLAAVEKGHKQITDFLAAVEKGGVAARFDEPDDPPAGGPEARTRVTLRAECSSCTPRS